MIKNAEFLQYLHSIMRLFERSGEGFCEKYGLTQIESNILMFLHNNPGRDTAKDIVEIRMLPKANVSKAVESLMQKGLLHRTHDNDDRRRIHLSLSESALRMMPELDELRDQFVVQLFNDFSAEEKVKFFDMNERIARNVIEGLERN